MGTTYTLISSNTLSSSAASVTFSSIPSTYTDLVLRCSPRNTAAGYNYTVALGGATGTYSETELHAEGTSTVGSTRTSNTDPFGSSSYIFGDQSNDTANSFGSGEMYIPNYAGSAYKPVSMFSVRETNATTIGIGVLAGLMRSTPAVTTITIASAATAFAAGSSFYLYGIKNS